MLLLLPALTPAQRITSDILGVVTDPSEAVVGDAAITVTETATGRQWMTVTDSLGAYRVQGLFPGVYEVRAERPGFATADLNNIEVLVNQEAVVNIRLSLGETRQVYQVSAQASILDSVTGQLSGMVNAPTLSELPLNGRDLSQLMLLQPGTYPTTNAGPNPWAQGGYTKAAVQGARPTMNNVNLDGGDINDPGYNVPPGGVSGVQMGAEAVMEYRVLLNSYSAEFGRNAGANIQLVTKSGTNDLHGSAYEYLRNADLDARNFYDLGGVPPFVRNQFGLSAGGPIRRNHTFFFANYEALRERKSVTASLTVPDQNAHLGLLPSASDPTKLVNVGVDPRVAPLLALFPAPNGPSIGGGLATLNTSGRQPTRADYGVIRIDSRSGSKNDFFARYVADDSASSVPFLSTYVPGFPGERLARNQYVMLSWLRTVTPRLINEAKLNYDRPSYLARADNQYPISISLLPGRSLGTIDISGLPSLGNIVAFPFGATSNVYEGIDNVSWQHGAHMLRAGIDVKRMQINGPVDVFVSGAYYFTDLTAFGLPAASGNPALEFFLHAFPTVYLGTDPQASNSDRGFRQTYFGSYLQDEYHARPNLTLTLGLRWEYWSLPTEQHGRIANIRNVETDSQATVGPLWQTVPLDLWSPRFGLAWSPGKDRKTVVRAAAGLLRDQIFSNLYSDVRFYPPFYRVLAFVLPNFLTPPKGLDSLIGFGGPPQTLGSFGITYRPNFPYYAEYTLNIQRQLAPDLIFQAAYAGSRGIHLPRSGEANPFIPALGQRINPNFGSIPLIVTDGQSVYNSGQFSLQKRFSHGLQLETAYTVSRSIDDQSGVFPSDYVSDSGVAQNFFDRKGERARSSFDRTHVFTASALWTLPIHSPAGALRTVAGGWQVGGILTLDSGVPFTADLGSFNNSANMESNAGDRPDVKPGVHACASTGQPDHWFDASIFTLPAPGQYGNAGRNILCGPPLKNFDFSLRKDFRLKERADLEFRAEFFNLLNHRSFDVPLNTQGPNGGGGNGDAIFIGRRSLLADGQPCTAATDPQGMGCGILAPNVGRIFRTVTTSRQIQFALKLRF